MMHINQTLRSQGHHSRRMGKIDESQARESNLSTYPFFSYSLPFIRRNVLSEKREFDLPMNNNYSILLRVPLISIVRFFPQ